VIKLPRRSVTRFFIPLIDVLILLFCIFLLMPFVSDPGTPKPPDPKDAKEPPLPTNVAELQRDLTEARERLKRLEVAAQARIADRLSVRVLQVGKDRNGIFLYYFDPDRQEIRTEADALKLVALQKTLAAKAGGVKDVLFLVMYPRDGSGNLLGYPLEPDEKTIRGWFREQPLKFEL
jgi:hypothetical protein